MDNIRGDVAILPRIEKENLPRRAAAGDSGHTAVRTIAELCDIDLAFIPWLR
jgi:hypothetical protein